MSIGRAKDGPALNMLLQELDMGPDDRTRPGAGPVQGTEEAPEDIPADQEIDFVTLGMFIIGMYPSTSLTHDPPIALNLRTASN
jgi:hypothetical protein